MGKMLGKVFLLAVVSLFIFSSGAFAEPVSLQMAEDVARTHLRANNERERLAALTARKVFEKRSISMPDIIELQDDQTGETLAYVLGLTPKGFIVVSPDTDITPVIAYSFKGNFPLEDFQDNVLLHMVTWDMENRLEAIPIVSDELKEKNNDLWEKYLSAENSFIETQVRATQYGPYLDTTWDQGSPYNTSCPKDPVTGNTSAVGCVATAMAQIVNYHEYPSSVIFTSVDDYTPGTWSSPITATDANIPSITYNDSNATAANLSFACGVSAHMNYSSGGSGAFHKDAASAYKNKFGYTSATAMATTSYWASIYGIPYYSDFTSILRENLRDANPAQLGIKRADGSLTHSIVCDGYNSTTGEYHLNYGWGITPYQPGTPSTWWYILPSEMPYYYRIIYNGILNIKPPAPGSNSYCTDSNPCAAGKGDCEPGQCQSGLTCVNDVGAKYGWRSIVDVCESTSGGTPGDYDYCTLYGPCSAGQGDCDGNSECQSGLTCVNDVGAKYGFDAVVDVCEASTGGTPGDYDYCTLYGPCSAGQGDCDSNAECQSGLSCVDDVGAKYGFDAVVDVCESSTGGNPGDDNYCTKYGPCSAGQGDCDSDSECQSGLTCVNDVGAKYGWKSITDVCEEAAVGNLTVYVLNSTGTRLLSGATVTVGGKSGTTGSGGYVTITGIAAGTKTITISYGGGYGSSSVNIVSGTTAVYTFWLGWVS